ncbi:MAG TPA: DMT family transporter [Rugosimonospora sp.]|nr:DMT family transporter [Rugosimonospora sp.]
MLPVLFGLLAAFLFAASASLQQHAAHRSAGPPEHDVPVAPPEPGGRLATRYVVRPLLAVLRPLLSLVRRLVRTPLWLFGWVTNLVGFLIQAVALHYGSVALVQPLLVTQLLFALPLASAWNRRWPAALDWLGGIAICAGVVVFLAVRGVAPFSEEPDRQRVVFAGLAAAMLVALLVVVSAGRPPLVHATLIAVASGLCFAMSAVLIKLTAEDLLQRGVPATAVDWPGYALAVSTLSGLLLEQGAFAAGSLSAAVAAMTITNPLVSYVIGVFAFGAEPPTSPGALAGLAGSGALLCIGVVTLAHSASVRPDATVEAPGANRLGSGGVRPTGLGTETGQARSPSS